VHGSLDAQVLPVEVACSWNSARDRKKKRLKHLGTGFLGAVLFGCFAWAYWPTLANFVVAWNREPDYSHGYLVLPLAVGMLWARRDRFPTDPARWRWAGVLLIAASVPLRWLAGLYYLEALDGWSILVWLAGVVWLFGGAKVFCWHAPVIAFLWFMIPLPYRIERWVSLPLQGVATKVSGWILQLFGQPALVKGHTILLGEHHLEIVQACSGLRIFMGIGALAYAYVVLVRRSWWERGVLLLSVIPIAILVNSFRIVATGLLYQYVSSNAAIKFSHDVAGLVMIPLAAAMFGLVLWYLCKLTQEAEQLEVSAIWQEDQSTLVGKT
jgi:exosortase